MTTPLSDERLAQFRRWVDQFNSGSGLDQEMAAAFLAGNAGDLLGEVERLRGIVQFHEALADVADDLRADLHECCKGLKNCDAEVSRLRARVARLVGVLRDVEWEGQMDEDDLYYPVATCPNCDGWQKQGHAPDCALDAALRDKEADDDDATE